MKSCIAFTPRAYGCTELAQLYSPHATPHGAWTTLRRWIDRIPGLWQRLEQMGYQRGMRRLSPKMVAAIVEAVGEP